MAYQNVNFPAMKLLQGFRVETQTPTVVVSNYGREYRINRFTQEKNVFTFPSRNLRYADWITIYNFLDSVGWQRDSFNLVRPDNGQSVKVRLVMPPSMEIVALSSTNTPTMVLVSDIQLMQVFNE